MSNAYNATILSPVFKNFLWRSHVGDCEPIQASIPEKVDSLGIQLLFSVLYLTVWLCAITGNLCVIYVVTLKQVSLSAVRSVFICSLAVSDILMSLTSLPITAVSIFTRDWVFPRIFCKLMGVFQGGSVFVSSFTLTAIAVDRYILIKHPASSKVNFNKALLSVILIWIMGYLFALPVGIFSNTEPYTPLCGLFCEETWPDINNRGNSQMRKTYGLAVLIIQFGLPLVISSICYYSIGRVINQQIKKRHQSQVLLQDNQNRLETRKHRSNRMMVAMVGGLVLAWLPMNLINLMRDFDASPDRFNDWYSLVFAGCHVVAMTSAVWNFVIYSWFNPQFKETLLQVGKQQKQSSTYHAVARTRSVANERPDF
ncbi:unnamed protein product [Bursaphelenchus okinawaensis]|uniref:G-protein coupled receptors family 1 profile domain-containing protein n=1 Tax=Bursaphelenchus okinawaensis TaxID=465554 RepID=A0A811L420_9BILA|nr:unnamed protein product [Bursaphelenchus okinawaensis]CAG9115696.1 unnamed protein product [Bursaphelenchus okinawaensis]